MPTAANAYGGFPDVKSILLNMASSVLFLLPIGAYFDGERLTMYASIVAGTVLIALLYPPVGYMRPHPYSDFDYNRPEGTNKGE